MKDLTLVMKYDGKPLTFARLSVAVWDVLKETGGEVLFLEEGDWTNNGKVSASPTEAEMAEEKEQNGFAGRNDTVLANCPLCQNPIGQCTCRNNRRSWVPEDPQPEPEKPKGRKFFKCGECGNENELVYELPYPDVMDLARCSHCGVSIHNAAVQTEVFE